MVLFRVCFLFNKLFSPYYHTLYMSQICNAHLKRRNVDSRLMAMALIDVELYSNLCLKMLLSYGFTIPISFMPGQCCIVFLLMVVVICFVISALAYVFATRLKELTNFLA